MIQYNHLILARACHPLSRNICGSFSSATLKFLWACRKGALECEEHFVRPARVSSLPPSFCHRDPARGLLWPRIMASLGTVNNCCSNRSSKPNKSTYWSNFGAGSDQVSGRTPVFIVLRHMRWKVCGWKGRRLEVTSTSTCACDSKILCRCLFIFLFDWSSLLNSSTYKFVCP